MVPRVGAYFFILNSISFRTLLFLSHKDILNIKLNSPFKIGLRWVQEFWQIITSNSSQKFSRKRVGKMLG